MPHITIEISKNVRDEIDVDKMLRSVHDAAIATGVFPPDGIRSRVHILKHYRVAESDENAFVHVVLRIGPGRDQETKRRVVDAVFNELTDYLQRLYDSRPLAISLELQELDADLRRNKNNLKVGVAAGR
jgi:5-carboxymethyl-2-hydroxymuconate isomerase